MPALFQVIVSGPLAVVGFQFDVVILSVSGIVPLFFM